MTKKAMKKAKAMAMRPPRLPISLVERTLEDELIDKTHKTQNFITGGLGHAGVVVWTRQEVLEHVEAYGVGSVSWIRATDQRDDKKNQPKPMKSKRKSNSK